jgi:putative tricarboxylic transport membrane protein
MHDSQDWKDVLTKNDWADAYLTADEFSTFMADQTKRVQDVLGQLGLA